MAIEFFLPMVPPTITQQEHRIGHTKTGKTYIYEQADLKTARLKLMDAVGPHAPETPLEGPLQLITKWIWPAKDGILRYKTTKPDTDNVVKMLKDCMTRTHFWNDDAQVASEITEKFLDPDGCSGIYIKVVSL